MTTATLTRPPARRAGDRDRPRDPSDLGEQPAGPGAQLAFDATRRSWRRRARDPGGSGSPSRWRLGRSWWRCRLRRVEPRRTRADGEAHVTRRCLPQGDRRWTQGGLHARLRAAASPRARTGRPDAVMPMTNPARELAPLSSRTPRGAIPPLDRRRARGPTGDDRLHQRGGVPTWCILRRRSRRADRWSPPRVEIRPPPWIADGESTTRAIERRRGPQQLTLRLRLDQPLTRARDTTRKRIRPLLIAEDVAHRVDPGALPATHCAPHAPRAKSAREPAR